MSCNYGKSNDNKMIQKLFESLKSLLPSHINILMFRYSFTKIYGIKCEMVIGRISTSFLYVYTIKYAD